MLKIEITCEKKWWSAQEAASEHYDESLNKCVIRLIGWMHGNSKTRTIRIGSDFGEHCFSFAEIREDESVGICGGIVFHGFSGGGYQTNGSVQIEPSYGWQIHT